MSDIKAFAPMYIGSTEGRRTGDIVTATDWNNRWNLQIQQGDNTAKQVYDMTQYFFGEGTEEDENNGVQLGVFTKTQETIEDIQTELILHEANTANPHSVTAEQVSANPVTGVNGTDVQAIAEDIKTQIDTKLDTATAAVTYETLADAALHIVNVTFDENTGEIRFHRNNGTIFAIDTALEKIAVNFTFDEATQTLHLIAADGTEQMVSLASFITPLEFDDSDDIIFTNNAGRISAAITNAYLNACTTAKNDAETAQTAAEAAAVTAQSSAQTASTAATTATNAVTSVTESASSVATNRTHVDTVVATFDTQYGQIQTDIDTLTSMQSDLSTYQTQAIQAATDARADRVSAETARDNARTAENNAALSKTAAATSATNAATSEANAAQSATDAQTALTSVQAYNDISKSYAVGGTGTRTGEDTDNASYYLDQCRSVAGSLAGGFQPMGTIAFATLATLTPSVGQMYNISDEFTTDATFKDGSGKTYAAGTNVYYTADNKWDCLSGSVPTVNGKTGNNITVTAGDMKLGTYASRSYWTDPASVITETLVTNAIAAAIGNVNIVAANVNNNISPAVTANTTAISTLQTDVTTLQTSVGTLQTDISGKLGATATAADSNKLGGVDATDYVTLSGTQALTNKTYEGFTLHSACSKYVTDNTTPTALIGSGTGNVNVVTQRAVYHGTPTINNSHAYTSGTNIYAPITSGSSDDAGLYLKSCGTGKAPEWKWGVGTADDITSTKNTLVQSKALYNFVKNKLPQHYFITIAAGDTTGTVTNENIVAEGAYVSFYFKDKIMAPTSATVSDGSITVEIEEQETVTDIAVEVTYDMV